MNPLPERTGILRDSYFDIGTGPASPSLCRFPCYNLFMNKRAKKRVKEAIEKENLERAKEREGQNHPSSNDLQKRRGFLPKPAKKRG